MSKLLLIANPIAGRGQGRRLMEKARRLLADSGFDCALHVTAAPGDARALAYSEARRYDVMAVLGGDGTIQEVAGGLAEARLAGRAPTGIGLAARAGAGGSKGEARVDMPAEILRAAGAAVAVLAILPAGTGNDLIKSVGIPAKLEKACELIRRGSRRNLDLGRIRWRADGKASQQERIFVNNVGLGFEGQVGWEARRIKLPLRGAPLYLLALARALRHLSNPPVTVTLSNGTILIGPKLLISVGNGCCSGGGFRLNPDADPFDGMLDLCIADARRRREVLRLIPRGLRGTHISLPSVRSLRETRFKIASSEPLHAHADGEPLSDRLTWAEFEILPGILPLIC